MTSEYRTPPNISIIWSYIQRMRKKSALKSNLSFIYFDNLFEYYTLMKTSSKVFCYRLVFCVFAYKSHRSLNSNRESDSHFHVCWSHLNMCSLLLLQIWKKTRRKKKEEKLNEKYEMWENDIPKKNLCFFSTSWNATFILVSKYKVRHFLGDLLHNNSIQSNVWK